MVPSVDKRPAPAFVRQVSWRGRSGRLYALSPERLEAFALRDNDLFLVARGQLPLWAGCADDVIHDADSRARFRLALGCADRVFHVDAGGDDVERLTAVWDLEGAEPVLGLSAA